MRTDAEKLKFFSFAASSKKREGGEHSKKTLTIYGLRQEKRDKCESTLSIRYNCPYIPAATSTVKVYFTLGS